MYSSTRMQPLSISMPEPSSQAVAGRMPMASTTMSAGSAPFGVSTPAARPAASPSPARMPVSGGRGHDAPTGCLELAGRPCGHLGVVGVRHDLVGGVDDRDGEAARGEVLGHLEADEAGAHDDGRPAAVRLDVGADALGVVGGAHAEYAGEVRARDRGHEGRGARGDDELVVGLAAHGAVRAAHGDELRLRVEAGRLHARLHVHAGEALVLGGRVHDELVARADVVRDTPQVRGHTGDVRVAA